MVRLIIVVLALVLGTASASSQDVVVRAIGDHSITLLNAADDKELWGWIELEDESGEGPAGYIYIHQDGEPLDPPHLSLGAVPYIVMHARLSQLDTPETVLAPGSQIPLHNGSVFLERANADEAVANERVDAVPLAEHLGNFQTLSVPGSNGNTTIRLSNWNIQTLTVAGEKVFANKSPKSCVPRPTSQGCSRFVTTSAQTSSSSRKSPA